MFDITNKTVKVVLRSKLYPELENDCDNNSNLDIVRLMLNRSKKGLVATEDFIEFLPQLMNYCKCNTYGELYRVTNFAEILINTIFCELRKSSEPNISLINDISEVVKNTLTSIQSGIEALKDYDSKFDYDATFLIKLDNLKDDEVVYFNHDDEDEDN